MPENDNKQIDTSQDKETLENNSVEGNKDKEKEKPEVKMTSVDWNGEKVEMPKEVFDKIRGIGRESFKNQNKDKIASEDQKIISTEEYEYFTSLLEKYKEDEGKKDKKGDEDQKRKNEYEKQVQKLQEELKQTKEQVTKELSEKEKAFKDYKLSQELLLAIQKHNPYDANHVKVLIESKGVIKENEKGSWYIENEEGNPTLNSKLDEMTISEYVGMLKEGEMKHYFKPEPVAGADLGGIGKSASGKRQINSQQAAIEALKKHAESKIKKI